MKRDKIYVQTGVMIMGWIEGIGEAINYIEENINEEITIKNIAKKHLYRPSISKKALQCFVVLRSESISGNAGLPLPAVSLFLLMKKSLILH